MQVLIEKFDHQGRGITHINGKISFVKNALPGEVVDVVIDHENRKIIEASVLDYIIKSDKRIESICPYYNVCGGCDLQHISFEDEIDYKYNKLCEIFKKYSSFDEKILKKVISIDKLNYRNKAAFHVNGNIGYYGRKNNDIVSIDKCLIVNEDINLILNVLKKMNLKNIYEIVIRCSFNTSDKMVVLKVNGKINNKYIIDNLSFVCSTIVLYDGEYKTIYGDGYIFELIGDYKYKISPDSFFQVNSYVCKLLYDKVLEYLKPSKSDNVLDLYCGTGTIGIYVSRYVNHVFGVEINKDAIDDANYNKKINNIFNIDFKCLNANLVDYEGYNKVIVDPPRSGLDDKTINYLLNSSFERIVYVSCDPVTLARDLNILKEKYDVLEITPVNMFERTYHVECVALLSLKTS